MLATKLVRFVKKNFQLAAFAASLGLIINLAEVGVAAAKLLLLLQTTSLSICFDFFNKIYCDDSCKTENDNNKEGNNKESQNKGKDQEYVAAANAAAKNNDTSSSGNEAADAATYFDIPSILESGDGISPLQALLNNEIAFLLLILVHMVIIAMILFNKFCVASCLWLQRYKES